MGTALLELARRLFAGEQITARRIRDEYGVSIATAHRYMLRLEIAFPVEVEEEFNGGRGHRTVGRKIRLVRGYELRAA